MATRLYAIPGSHPSMTARLMLERKGVPYARVDLLSPVHRPVMRALRFPGVTVPALSIDGRRVQGTRAIARFLDELRPEPALLPADPDRRLAVEEAERFGDEDLQPAVRRIVWWAMGRDRSGVKTFLEGARLGLPVGVLALTAAPFIWAAARANHATEDAVRADLSAIPGLLDRVDALIAEGALGGPEPNAADYQIAPSVRLLMCFDDLRPSIEGRPAGEHAMRVCPTFPGRVPPVLDADERRAALGAAA